MQPIIFVTHFPNLLSKIKNIYISATAFLYMHFFWKRLIKSKIGRKFLITIVIYFFFNTGVFCKLPPTPTPSYLTLDEGKFTFSSNLSCWFFNFHLFSQAILLILDVMLNRVKTWVVNIIGLHNVYLKESHSSSGTLP